MPVSTDGVLLGAWTQVSGQHVLDIGSGTGLLSLMIAQRYHQAQITAVDIDNHAYQDASHNVAHSPWAQRVNVMQGDIAVMPFTHQFDTIICNPPYFNSGQQAQSASRATARHTDTLSHPTLLKRCQQLLTDKGRASFVLPTAEGMAFIQLAQQNDWHLSRLCQVHTTDSKGCHRLLIELSLHNQQQRATEQTTLVIHDSKGGYSDDFIALTQAFYLKM
ncbi:tRNA1(Val) (adenine(37)-N6)-methyltransferase [Vibrio hippocampi]|uniref:tRNA1(Val) (adenine(37)-N6)-methyltransferase n=2 Tax=Vibrio hippocampi TaxID=654686 RepID=A0ABN8DLT3_9VIBR|nr:tRNA1(Val) (adenine(37)-N6)-methyltransferase [Vibrio hippocampi]